mgnify:FL=1
MKKQSRSFEIALSAIACAVAALALTLGSYVDVLLAAGYLIAVFALMVPLAKGQVFGYCLAYAGAVILAFLFTGFVLGVMQILPFVVFFGLHPLANYFQKKYVRRKLLHEGIFLVKAAWFDCSLWLAWVVLEEFLGLTQLTWYPFVSQHFFLILFVGGTVVFALYDYMIFLCQNAADGAIRRIGR